MDQTKADLDQLVSEFQHWRNRFGAIRGAVKQQRPTFFFFDAVAVDADRLEGSLRSLAQSEATNAAHTEPTPHRPCGCDMCRAARSQFGG